jgi:hypothetical protein
MSAEQPATPARVAAERAFYEGLLSDHPPAATERARRQASYRAHEADQIGQLREWVARTRANPDAGEPARRLANVTERLLDRRAARLAADRAEPAPDRLARLRQQLELAERAGADPDYRYPARYLGPQAARQPIPPDPDRQRQEADRER